MLKTAKIGEMRQIMEGKGKQGGKWFW